MDCDMLLVNGNVITMDNTLSKHNWVAVHKERIIAVGNTPVPSFNTRILLDLQGKTLLPGFIDSHAHGSITGINLNSIDLSKATSLNEVIELVEVACQEPGDKWVFGAGLMPQYLKEKRAPTRWELDRISGDHPVLIEYVTLHGSVVNSKALEFVAIPLDLPGVEKDQTGSPTGCFTSDESSFFVSKKIFASLSKRTIKDYYLDFVNQAISQGVTTVHSLDGQFFDYDKDIEVIFEIKDSLPIRVVNYYQTLEVERAQSLGLPRIGGCLTLDGAGFEHTMALFEPYQDNPKSTGVLYFTDEELYNFVSRVNAEGMQCAMHAIGDRAIDQLIKTYSRVIKEQGNAGLRHRIEHFSLPLPQHIEIAAELGLALPMQPIFSYLWDLPDEPDGGFYEVLLGRARADAMEPFPKIIEQGGIISGGSDSPVTSVNPLLGVHSCVNNPNPKRRISLTEALKMFTINGAWAAHEERDKGSIEVGKFADFVILDKDPYKNHAEINSINVEATIVGGRIVYGKGDFC